MDKKYEIFISNSNLLNFSDNPDLPFVKLTVPKYDLDILMRIALENDCDVLVRLQMEEE